MHVEANHLGNVEQLDNVDASAAAFDGGNNRLIAAEALGHVGLAQAGAFALLDEEIDEAQLSG